MKTMKTMFALVLTVVLTCSLFAGCASSTPQTPDPLSAEAVTTETVSPSTTTVTPEPTTTAVKPTTTVVPPTTPAAQATTVKQPDPTTVPTTQITTGATTNATTVITQAPTTAKKQTTTVKPTTTTTKKTTTTTTTKTTTTTAAPKPTVAEPFIHTSNYFGNINAVTINPRYVYWENGMLVAECFVINGYSHGIYNIRVNELTFRNVDVLLASGSFGTLDGLSIAADSYVVWTFRFSSDCVAAYGYDLSLLNTHCNVKNNF